MNFKALENIESSFQRIRLLAIIFLCACTLCTGYAIWQAFSFAEAQRQKIYVLDKGKSLMLALSQDLQQNRPVEAREHVRRFHELLFTLAPDEAAITDNVERALKLSDKSAYLYYNDMMEKGYYNRIIASNISQLVKVDSINCHFDNYPYQVVTYARQIIIRESTVTERSLVTTCQLRESNRSDNSPQGFIIEKFTVIENKDIREYDR